MEYANRHRYDFILERCPRDTDISWKWDPNRQFSLVWYKPEVLLKHLPSYHYIVYIDDDAFFVDHSISIENIIKTTMKKSTDCVMALAKDMPGGHDVYNTGVIIIKNAPVAFDILERWISSTSDDDVCDKWRYAFTYEQACISALAETEFKSYIAMIDPILVEREDTSKWVRHLYGTSTQFRNKELRKYLQTIFQSI